MGVGGLGYSSIIGVKGTTLGEGGGDGFLADLVLKGDVNTNFLGFSFFPEFRKGEEVVYLLGSGDYLIGVGLILTYSI